MSALEFEQVGFGTRCFGAASAMDGAEGVEIVAEISWPVHGSTGKFRERWYSKSRACDQTCLVGAFVKITVRRSGVTCIVH